jgi:hypothetical protein
MLDAVGVCNETVPSDYRARADCAGSRDTLDAMGKVNP